MQEDKFICYQCILDEHVKAKIKNKGNREQHCSYCHKKVKNISIEQLGEWVDSMFDTYYELGGYDHYGDGRGEEAIFIIEEDLGVDFDVAEDIYESMKNNLSIVNYYDGCEVKYDVDSTFVPIKNSRGNYDTKWEEITRSLKHESRFFNKEAKAFLDELFKDIHTRPNGSEAAI